LFEQRFCLREILFPLWEVLGVTRVIWRVHVVAKPPVAAQSLLDHLLAIHDQPEGLTHAYVVERLLIDAHGEGVPTTRLRLEKSQTGVLLDHFGLRTRHKVDMVDSATKEGVQARRRVSELSHREAIGVRSHAPVVRVGLEDRLIAGNVTLNDPRTGPYQALHAGGGVVPDRHDSVAEEGQSLPEDGVRPVEREAHGPFVQLLYVPGAEVAQEVGAGSRCLRVQDPLIAPDHVVGGHRLAVAELETRLQAYRERSGRRIGLIGLGEQVDQLVVRVEAQQGVVKLPLHGDLGFVDVGGLAIEAVLGTPTGDTGPDVAALLWPPARCRGQLTGPHSSVHFLC
jgi:hypothetical protein